MKIVIASDFSGFRLKEAVKGRLLSLGHEVMDRGQLREEDRVPYHEAAVNLARAMRAGEAERGVVICGTGAGVSLIVNKFRGVYCVACESVFTAAKTSLINNANVLAMGEKIVSYEMGMEMAEAWVGGVWCEGFAAERKRSNEQGFAVLRDVEEANFRP